MFTVHTLNDTDRALVAKMVEARQSTHGGTRRRGMHVAKTMTIEQVEDLGARCEVAAARLLGGEPDLSPVRDRGYDFVLPPPRGKVSVKGVAGKGYNLIVIDGVHERVLLGRCDRLVLVWPLPESEWKFEAAGWVTAEEFLKRAECVKHTSVVNLTMNWRSLRSMQTW